MAREGSNLAVERLSVDELWTNLERNLHGLNLELEELSSPRLYMMARTAWDCYAEIMVRGDQLQLFPEGPTAS